jgi:PAS domain S-box-containing protein
MGIFLRILIVEDSEDDTLLLLNLLKRNGYEVTHERVEKEDAMRFALQEKSWDIILCDYKMPGFDGMRALKVVSEMGIDIPFIVVSGTIGEDVAVECMKAGAHDYVMKDKLQRLIPAVEREIREAAAREERRKIERELNNLALVVKHSSELIYLAAPDGTMVFMNEAGRDKIGIPLDEVTQYRILDIFSPDYKESVKRVILPELMKSGSWQGDLQCCNIRTGKIIDVYASFFTIKDASTGTFLYIANVSTDTSERKKTEKEIMHLASFSQFSPILTFEMTKEGVFTYVNPATQRVLAEMEESNAALFIPQDIHAMVREGKISEEKEITREVVLHGRTYTENICFLPLFNSVRIYAFNITERKQAEEALKRSEMYYRLIFENSGEAILLTALDGSVFSANPEACRMLHCTEAEICSVGRNGVIDPTDPRLPAALEEREQTGRFKGELTCQRFDGQKFPCELSSIIFRDQDGQLRTSMILHDLTERKKLEEKLRESQRFTISIIDALTAHIAVLDEKGTIIDVNYSWRKFAEDNLPVPVNVNEGANYLSVCDMAQGEDSEIAAMFAEGIRSVISGKREMFSLGYPCHSPDKERWFTGSVTRFSGLGPIRVVVAHEDITDRKRAEEALQKSEEQYRNIFNDAILGIYQTTPEGLFLTVNPALARMLGYDEPAELIDSVVDLSTQTYVNPEDRETFREILLRKGVVEKFETRLRTKSGEIIWVSINAHVVKDTQGNIACFEGTVENINDKKHVEDVLKKSEQKYRSIFENTIEGIFQSTTDGHFLTVNSAFARMHGYESPDEMIKNVTNIEKQLYANHIRRDEFVRILYERGVVINFEHQQLRKDGSKIWVRINAREVRDDDNNVLHYEGTAEDITESKKAEETLRESEEHFRLLAEQSLMAIGIIQDGVFKYFNRKYEEVCGYSADEIKGWKPFEFSSTFHPDDVNIVVNQIKKKQAGNPDVIPHYYFRIIHKNGDIRWVEVYSKTVTYEDRPADMVTLIDITERKKAENALRESEERYKTITEKTIAGIYLIQGGLFRYVNPTFCSIYGYTRDELVDKLSPLDLVVEEEKEFLNDKIRQRLSEEKESDEFSIRVRRKDGEIRFLEVFSSYTLYAGKPAVLGTCIDMTEARRANEAIKRSQKELRSLTAYLQNVREDERTRIAREIHDELGQSLTGIKIDISWLKKKLSNIVGPADPIQTKIDTLLALTESTIATTRELSLSLRPGILDDLGLATAINWQLKRFQEKVGIICMLQSDVAEITIPADYATALFRISQECLTNISRHANATKVEITLIEKGENLVLEIKDNGKGITTEQIRNPISLGLLGMKERVKNLKGKFHISGAPGKGTKVRVELPMK